MADVLCFNPSAVLADIRRESAEPDYCFASSVVRRLLGTRRLVLGLEHDDPKVHIYYFAVDGALIPGKVELVGQSEMHPQMLVQYLLPRSPFVRSLEDFPEVHCLDHGSDLTDYLQDGNLGGCLLQSQATR